MSINYPFQLTERENGLTCMSLDLPLAEIGKPIPY
jgi:hypothetical protein